MGAINYGTSNYITIGLKPYNYSDFENDGDCMEAIQEEIALYGGTVENKICDLISSYYEDDYSNIESVLNKYDFGYFHVVIKHGYYEGFYIDIENNYDVCYDCWQDKQAALKEATQIKRFLLECVDMGLCEVWPGWCTAYKDRKESIASIKAAIKSMKEEIKSIPTWRYCERMGIEV